MSTREPAPPQSALALWWGRFVKAFVGVGALAGVVTAVLAATNAVHPPDEEEFAQFREVAVQANMPYSEYHQYLVPPTPVAKSLGGGARVPVAATPTLITPPTAKQADPPATSVPTSAPTSSPTPSPGTTSSSASPLGPGIGQPEVGASGSLRLAPGGSPVTTAPAGSNPAGNLCGGNLGCRYLAIIILPTQEDGTPVSQGKKAEVVKKVVKGSRTTWVKKTRKKEMVGVVINVNLELGGLRGKRVLLSWQLWRGDGTTQVYGEWLNDNFAYEIVAGSNHDSAALNFWIPMPKKKGPYFIRTKLVKDGQTLATIDSKPIT